MKRIKNIITIAIFIFSGILVNAQAPQGFNYQAVIRDGGGNLVTSGTVRLRFSILESNPNGATIWQEIHDTNPNGYGLVTAVIGQGAGQLGDFTTIEWGSNACFLKVEADPTGQNSFTDLGTNKLLSVPYALSAGDNPWVKSGNNIYFNSGNVGIGVANPTRKLEISGNNISIGQLVAGRAGNSLVFGIDAIQGGNTNSAFGERTLRDNSNGFDNSAFGHSALINNTSGASNSAFGVRALENNVTGTGLTGLGHLAGVSGPNFSNSAAIGNFSSVDASNKIRLGNGAVNSIGGQVSWSNFSDKRIKDNVQENVVGLEFIKALRPVTYHFNVRKQEELMGNKEVGEWEGKYDIENIQFSGFIAQEVEIAAKKVGYDFSGLDKSGDIMGVRYAEFTVPIIKAMQEQQQMIEEMKKEIELLKSIIEQR